MYFRRAIAITMAFIALAIPALAIEAPSAQCTFNADKSILEMLVANSDAKSYGCTASCQYTVKGKRPLQTFGCNYSLSANEAEKTACTLKGDGPDHFAEIRPTRFVCQPR